MKYGAKLCCYESGDAINAANGVNANVGLAIMDAGSVAPFKAYGQGVLNSGFAFLTHVNSGVTMNTSYATSPGWDLSNIYSSPVICSRLTALQSFMAGFTPTRNVVS